MMSLHAFKNRMNKVFNVDQILVSAGWDENYEQKRQDFLKSEGYSE